MATTTTCGACDTDYTLTSDAKCVANSAIIADCKTMATLTKCGECNPKFNPSTD